MEDSNKPSDYIPVADVEISSVRPQRTGFSLQGRGADRADYRIDLELEVPVDQRTRSVLAELLSQSRWRISRKAAQTLRGATRPARSRTGQGSADDAP
jgi:hypothetical protein